jgi:DNA polymerase III delta subunit
MNISWDKPPLVMAIAGDERFLRRRWLHHAALGAFQAGYEVVHAGSDGEVIAALSMTAAFGQPTLILVDGDKVDLETVKTHLADKPKQVCIIMEVSGEVNPKIHPAVALVKKKCLVNYSIPARKTDKESRAAKFLQMEAHRLMSSPEVLTDKLAFAMVGVLGVDLGVLAHEVGKVTALVRSQGGQQITARDVKAVVRGHLGVEMQPLRDALAFGHTKKVAKALAGIRRKSASDPTMLLLRSRGGPADLAYQWLQVSILLKRGKTSAEIATLVGSPSWRVERSLIPAAKRWGTRNLVRLVRDLAHADRGVFKGVPSPWVACEAALLRGCCSVGA